MKMPLTRWTPTCAVVLLRLAVSAPAAIIATNFWPAPDATNVCPDTPLRISFATPPRVNNRGLIRIYRADGTLVDTINLSLTAQTRVINGFTFTNYAVITNGCTASIFPHPASLTNGQSYYVNIDSAIFSGTTGDAFAGIATTNTWRFMTRPISPPPGATHLVAAADGSGDFCTVQGAVDFVPWGNTNRVRLSIRNGTYQEIVYVTNKHNLTFSGQDRKQTVLTYANNEALNQKGNVSNYFRAMFGVSADGMAFENLTFSNSTPKGNNGNSAQAEALRLDGDRHVIRNCDFYSYQDTVKFTGRVYVQDCYVEGDVDFMWGSGTVYYASCEIKTLTKGAYLTQIRNGSNVFGNVYVDCRFTCADGVTNVALSRIQPNRFPYSHVAYINCAFGNHILPAGWVNQTSGADTSNLRFWEYQSVMLDGVTPLATNSRVAFSRQLTAAEAAQMRDVTNILRGWLPQLPPQLD